MIEPEETMTTQSSSQRRFNARRSPMEHPCHQYPHETIALQQIANECGLIEKIKWGKPCFTLDDKNVALLQRFNSYIALMFFKGALLKDPGNLLVRISDKMNGPRQLRFTKTEEIYSLATTISAYLTEASAIERSGTKLEPRSAKRPPLPAELELKLEGNPALNRAFAALTRGRQKGYIFYIAGAKQSNTRSARVEKNIARILDGKGLHD